MVYERPGASVILVRSVSYGVGAGAVLGFTLGLLLSLSDPAPWVIGLAVSGFGAAFGGATGLVLGLLLLLGSLTARTRSRALAAVVAMTCVSGGLWILIGRLPRSGYLLLFVVPAGLAAWFLLPVVLRPEGRGEMPKLPGHSI